MLFEILLTIIIVILVSGYLIGHYNEVYWKKRGVKFYKRNKVTGLFWDYMFQDRPFFDLLYDFYKQYPEEPAVAFGSFFTPSLYVKDMENIQHVTHNDFQSFQKRGIPFSKEDKLAQNLLLIHGQKWKLFRQKMTPLFTTAKLKNMYYIMDKSAKDFVEFLKTNPDKLKGNGFDTMNTYCCAATAASVFGIGTKSTFESPFIELVKEALHPTVWKNIKFAIGSLSTPFFEIVGLSLFSVHEKWFIDAIKKVIREREKENVKKHDFADLCVSLQKNGMMKDSETGFEMKPTDEALAAQAFFYFLAGLEPCASTMFTAAVELGRNPDVLKKLQQIIDELFDKTGGELTYDHIADIEYLDNVIDEALRLYPPIGFNIREASSDTVLPVGNIKVDKGTKIYMPIFEHHHDERFFKNAEEFNPERFTNRTFSEDVYLPFGKGHRVCIGMRYAKLQVKTGLVYLLRHFNINTVIQNKGIGYSKQQFQVRLSNVDIEFVPRN